MCCLPQSSFHLDGLFDAVGDDATGSEAVGAEFIPDSNMIEMAQCLNVKPSRRNAIHRCPGQVNGIKRWLSFLKTEKATHTKS